MAPAIRRASLWLSLTLLALGGAPARADGAAGSAPIGEAWDKLAKVRDQLRSSSPLAAAFEQSFLPSGFSTGDTESGTLFLDLPKCLRFEYQQPLAKNFLLCGDWVYTWNPGEPSGRRFLVDDGEAEGIDLLRLDVEALSQRYRAEFGSASAGIETIRLVPKSDSAQIREAAVELEAIAGGADSNRPHRLLALSYEDRSGNLTRFELEASRPLETRQALEAPPLAWLED